MRTLVSIRRILMQLKADPRTVFLILGVPLVLVALIYYAYVDAPTAPGQARVFDSISPLLIAIIPMFLMFIVTSVSMLRERRSGTLERILTTPTSKLSLVLAYGLVFGALAAVQGSVLTCLVRYGFDVPISGSMFSLIGLAILTGVVGVSLGLAASAFAQTEFQAVQFMPAFILPQFILCGLLVRREDMPEVLHKISAVLPMSWAVDIARSIATSDGLAETDVAKFLLLAAVALVFLGFAAAMMRRVAK